MEGMPIAKLLDQYHELKIQYTEAHQKEQLAESVCRDILYKINDLIRSPNRLAEISVEKNSQPFRFRLAYSHQDPPQSLLGTSRTELTTRPSI